MARRKSSSRTKLSFEQANAICRGFLPIGEAIFDYMKALQEAGFTAFVPHHEFTKSFCGGPDEAELHRRCLIEQAKNLLGRPWPFRTSAEEEGHLYCSPFIQRLCQERDEANGVPVAQLSSRYPGEVWRLHIDPCERRMAYANARERQIVHDRWNAVAEERRRRLGLEAARHATGLARSYAFDKRGRYEFLAAAMERHAAPLGFHHRASQSCPGYPIFSKRINEHWDLCWAFEEPAMFYWSPVEGDFIPYLEVRNRELVGSIEKAKPGEFLFIRHRDIVPGFEGAYRTFFGLDELEVMIKAHLCLYGLMAPVIEGALQRVLGTAPA